MSEKQISEMAKIIDDNHGFIVSSVETAEALYNAGYRKQSEWISVEERLPHVSDEVLCYIKEYDSIDIYYYTGMDEWDNDRYCGSTKYTGITHWMPLPPQPKENGHNWATVVPKAPNACDELASISKKIDEIFNDENVSEETKAIMSAEFIGMFTGNIGKIGDKIGKMKGKDMELNREQIIRALEWCIDEGDCEKCPIGDVSSCHIETKSLALIKELTEDLHATHTELTRVQEENEILTINLSAYILVARKVKTIKADTVRKMQERLRERLNRNSIFKGITMSAGETVYDVIDQIAKEMLEG